MNLNIYSLFDDKAKSFATPFFMHNDDVAKRAVQGATMDRQSVVSAHPEDFQLFCLGYFDDQKGMIIPNSHPTLIASVITLRPASFNAIDVTDGDENLPAAIRKQNS